MPSYYDESTKSWFCKFYYSDYTGANKQKKKRGFKGEPIAGTPYYKYVLCFIFYTPICPSRIRRILSLTLLKSFSHVLFP
ncbi:Arm DNA-binding domain-containing protein [Parablautia intestinalis]|uniref:Arm DNA-binding domain-containing protein n=1 Tax=Parablautia intestinalis TaxID=2320100 RepID=UPI0023CBACCF|nr:Arm DNA-binding domain-containing protein [Lachnospiraceae bacterium]